MKIKLTTFDNRKKLYGVLFLLPWLLGFLFLFVQPMLESLRFSFGDLALRENGGYTVDFIGLRNYIYTLTENSEYNRVLAESVGDMFINVPIILFFSFFVATLLNQKFRGRGLARAIFFLPVILASGIIDAISKQSIISAFMQGMTYGTNLDPETTGLAVNALQSFELRFMLRDMGMNDLFVDYLTGAVDRIYDIISMSGVQILIFLAGLQAISPSIYEASKIEGATSYEIFWKVTFPMISPLFFTNVIYSIIDNFADNDLTTLIYNTSFKTMEFGVSSAMAWIYFIVVSILLAIVAFLLSKRVFYYD